ncbi:DUF6883 domain-containing protein [Ignavibacterium album]|uniref:DUF6883 domain-containing protein n=1 Tax=Ignavibacterium album TaxID=591197 RepID=UPI0026F06B5E|nr:DUF6883 domain-containing protein [Ignavibacterium album]
MKIPDNYAIIINTKLFNDYILNQDHLLGKLRAQYLLKYKVDIQSITEIVEQLKKIPYKQEYQSIETIYKAGLYYKLIYLSTINLNKQKVLVKSFWLIKNNSASIELLNFNFL